MLPSLAGWSPTKRVRHIVDPLGAELLLTSTSWPEACVELGRLDQRGTPTVAMSVEAANVLASYLKVAEMSVPDPLPPELVPCRQPLMLELILEPVAHVRVSDKVVGVVVPAPAWARLSAELELTVRLLMPPPTTAGDGLH